MLDSGASSASCTARVITAATGFDGPMLRGGDGWVRCASGHRHWGRFGAAGLLVRAGADTADPFDSGNPGTPANAAEGRPLILLQHRALWSHHGGTWGLPGGARDPGETAITAALREAAEET